MLLPSPLAHFGQHCSRLIYSAAACAAQLGMCGCCYAFFLAHVWHPGARMIRCFTVTVLSLQVPLLMPPGPQTLRPPTFWCYDTSMCETRGVRAKAGAWITKYWLSVSSRVRVRVARSSTITSMVYIFRFGALLYSCS